MPSKRTTKSALQDVRKNRVRKNGARKDDDAGKMSVAGPAAAPHLTLRDFVAQAWPILEPVTPLAWNWHLDLICQYLTLIRDNRFKLVCGQELEGIIFNVPPRTMKSLLISVFFPIWLWASHPSRRFMFVSYSERLSTQHSVFRRGVIESDWYQRNWGGVFTFSKDQNLKSHYENSERGAMFSTGMQATATGLGGDVLVFDDPLNPEQAISQLEREAVNLRFDTTFRSRINDPVHGVKIIVMQRLHELDLTGHVLAREARRWKHLSLPAIAPREQRLHSPDGSLFHTRRAGDLLWPGRLPQSFLEGQRIGMGSWAFNGQYQQSPAPLEGGIVKRQWVRFYRQLPEKFDFMVQSWDCTFSGGSDHDFVAGQVWGRSAGKYLMLPYRTYDRLDFGPTMAAIKSCHAKFPRAHAILIEDRANGPAIISELQKEIPGVVPVNPEGGKIARAQATAPLWEAGSIELPDPQVFDVPWMEDYLHNLCTFPKAAHDDDVDATSQALIYMRSRLGGGIFDFYRRRATGEPVSSSLVQPQPVLSPGGEAGEQADESNGSQAGQRNDLLAGKSNDSQAGGSQTAERQIAASSGESRSADGLQSCEAPGLRPALRHGLCEKQFLSESAMARAVLAAVEQGSRIECNAKQYPAIRVALLAAAGSLSEQRALRERSAEADRPDAPPASSLLIQPEMVRPEMVQPEMVRREMVRREIERLDRTFNWPG